MRRYGGRVAAMLSALALLALGGCHTDMWVQNKAKPLQESDFFADRQASRLPVEGTVARGQLRDDELRFKGVQGVDLASEFPFPITAADMRRGREQFDAFCSPCHGRTGDGRGMIAQRGLALRRMPANYHEERLRRMPVGHFYNVITNGHGVMFSYASRVEPDDRWRIAAYIRALQLSRNYRTRPVASGPGTNDTAQDGGAQR